MQRLPKQIAAVELGAALADLYTVPANTKTTVSACSVTNKTATARLVTVTIKSATGAARNVAFNSNVAPNETKVIHGALGQTIESGGVLAAGSDAGAALDFVTSAYESNI
jgi:hypothetical protein